MKNVFGKLKCAAFVMLMGAMAMSVQAQKRYDTGATDTK